MFSFCIAVLKLELREIKSIRIEIPVMTPSLDVLECKLNDMGFSTKKEFPYYYKNKNRKKKGEK